MRDASYAVVAFGWLAACSTFYDMQILTISIPDELNEALERHSAAVDISKTDLAHKALRRYLWVVEFRNLRSKLVMHARAVGFDTDDEVFDALCPETDTSR